jgi:hypothetical protein
MERRRKKFIRRFAEHGATCRDRAIPFDNTGMRCPWIFKQMVARGCSFAPGTTSIAAPLAGTMDTTLGRPASKSRCFF